MHELAGAQVAREEQADAGALQARTAAPKQARPDEYAALINRSLQGPLNAADQSRLRELAGQREVAAGRATADDLQSEQPPPAAPAAQQEQSQNE